jgi:hypothetical protein
MKKSIWRFSIGGLLVFMTLIAIVVAFVANYPAVAFLIIFGGLYALFESGAIVQLIQALSKPSVYLRHPFVTVGVSLLTGLPFLAFSVACFVVAANPNSTKMALIPAILFGVLGVSCLIPLILLVRYSLKAKRSQQANE